MYGVKGMMACREKHEAVLLAIARAVKDFRENPINPTSETDQKSSCLKGTEVSINIILNR